MDRAACRQAPEGQSLSSFPCSFEFRSSWRSIQLSLIISHTLFDTHVPTVFSRGSLRGTRPLIILHVMVPFNRDAIMLNISPFPGRDSHRHSQQLHPRALPSSGGTQATTTKGKPVSADRGPPMVSPSDLFLRYTCSLHRIGLAPPPLWS